MWSVGLVRLMSTMISCWKSNTQYFALLVGDMFLFVFSTDNSMQRGKFYNFIYFSVFL